MHTFHDDVRLEPALAPQGLLRHVALHEGTTAPRMAPYLHLPYEADAVVPDAPWRTARPQEYGRLVAASRGEGTVCLVRLPERLWLAYRAALRPLDDCTDAQQFGSHLQGGAVDALAASIGEAVSGWAQLATTFRCRISRAGLPTVTDRDGHLIGLHVDSWFGNGPLRNDPPARLCINVGGQSRTFLFVARRLATLKRSLEADVDASAEGTGLARQLLSRHRCAVFRLRIPSGWGYIAPTEELIHDGSTQGMSTWDVVAYAHGRFDFSAIPDAWRV